MGSESIFLLIIAAILLIGIIGEIAFSKSGVPDVIWLILVGIIVGPISGLVSASQLQTVAPYFGALTLVVVLFDGGSELRLGDLSKAVGRGTLLAITGFILSVVLVTVAARVAVMVGLLPDSWGWLQCILLGTILGGSSSVVIMPALKLAGLSTRLSNLVNYESALTDVLSVVATGAFIAMAEAQSAAGADGATTAGVLLGKKLGIGLGVGAAAGFMSLLGLRQLRKTQYAYPLTLGLLLMLYVLIDEMGGSAALGILAAAVILGNAPSLSKAIGLARSAKLSSSLQGVHDEITFIIKSFFFVFIGAMLRPPWTLLILGFAIGILLLIARLPSVRLATAGNSFSTPSKNLISVLYPRGMAAGVLAIMPYQAGVAGTKDLPVVVFSAVFTTILVFAVGFPLLRPKLPKSDLASPEELAQRQQAISTAGMSLASSTGLSAQVPARSAQPATAAEPSDPHAAKTVPLDAQTFDTVGKALSKKPDDASTEPAETED